MWRSKKLIVGAVLAVVLLAGSIGGVALADVNGGGGDRAARCEEFLDKVCENYGEGIDCDKLKAAFTDARSQMHPEGMPNRGEWDPEARLERLQNLYEEGKITEEQYNKMKERIESMPEGPFERGFQDRGGMRGVRGPASTE